MTSTKLVLYFPVMADLTKEDRSMTLGKHFAVASIDFGTTFSGWAVSFRSEFEKDPSKVFAKNWNSGDNISTKTPTALLIRPDGETVEAFGYAAENRYTTLEENGEHAQYYYFRRFKMKLFNQKVISRTMTLEEVNGKKLPAMLVFQSAIRYLKDDLLEDFGKSIKGTLRSSDIHWALTVPAIWNEKAKKFMKEAAIKAGIHRLRLSLVLEPEAASAFCQNIPLDMSNGGHIGTLKPGASYMVIDCGGGTIDICCHKVLPDRKLKEIHKASGDALGGTNVDGAFESFLTKLFGFAVWNKFKIENIADYLSFFRSFEVKKREIKVSGTNLITFSLPGELVTLLGSKTPLDVQQAVTAAGFQDDIKVLKANKIRVDSDFLMHQIYDDVIIKVQNLLGNLMLHRQVINTGTVLLVGGFSESPVLQDCVRTAFPDKQVVTIKEPEMAVVKGAVMYGHTDSLIEQRIARYTYGYIEGDAYDENIHPLNQLRIYENKTSWVHIFKPIVHVGQTISADFAFKTESTAIYENQDKFNIELLAVDEDDEIPKYSDDVRCIKLGSIKIPITDKTVPLEQRNFEFTITFGGTEITASGLEVATHKTTEGQFDFIG